MSANEARRRTDPTRVNPKTDSTRPYEKEDLDENSIRLIEIHPTTQDSDPVVCTLRNVAFGIKPKFMALSYMWGTGDEDNLITLNGCSFGVRKNLLDALIFLRRQAAEIKLEGQLVWIDAICIDQDNVKERNRQLRIMNQIYFRASMVAVWLGSQYTVYQNEMLEASDRAPAEEGNEQRGEESRKHSSKSTQTGKIVQQKMAQDLSTNPYWNRLWILQEIGRARQLRVCFGNEARQWGSFIHFLNMHNSDGGKGPLRLNRLLREEKYNDSHTLKRLLEEHKDALCSEPRDKVYGLIGLAADAAGFPMDYNKSLYDVWRDVMHFINGQGLFNSKGASQILPFGTLVRDALLQNNDDPLSQIAGRAGDRIETTRLLDTPTNFVFRLDAVVLGCIVHVGPSISEIISQLNEASAWRAATQQIFSGRELGSALQEHDTLLSALLDSDTSDVESKCFNRPSTVVWEDKDNAKGYICSARKRVNYMDLRVPRSLQQASDSPVSTQPRLFLASDSCGTNPRKMGVASGLVQPGDLVCWVQSSRRALLVRSVRESKLRVFGTAVATEDVYGWHPDFDCARRWRSLAGEKRMSVEVDAGTLFTLLR